MSGDCGSTKTNSFIMFSYVAFIYPLFTVFPWSQTAPSTWPDWSLFWPMLDEPSRDLIVILGGQQRYIECYAEVEEWVVIVTWAISFDPHVIILCFGTLKGYSIHKCIIKIIYGTMNSCIIPYLGMKVTRTLPSISPSNLPHFVLLPIPHLF